MAGKIENKIFEEYENENYYLLWWSDKRHFPYNYLGHSDEDNSVSRTDNFVDAIVFNSVIYIFSCTHLPEIETLQEITIWNYRSPNYLQCRPSWVTAHAQFSQVTFMTPKYHSLCSHGTSTLFCFHVFCPLFSVFQLVRVYLLFIFISPVIFGYVTFHSFVFTFSSVVSVVWFTFFCR